MVDARDKRMGLDTAARKNRQDLASLATPQGGVDALAGQFPNAKPAMAGVSDSGDASMRAVPTFGMKNESAKPTGR